MIHKSPDTRETYVPHGLKGWYVGGAPEHYRCFDIWCPDTRRMRQGETVRFPPHDHVLPGLSPHEKITRSIHELIAALKDPHPESPTATFVNEQTQALIQLAIIRLLALPMQPAMTQRSGLPAPPPPKGATCSPTSEGADTNTAPMAVSNTTHPTHTHPNGHYSPHPNVQSHDCPLQVLC